MPIGKLRFGFDPLGSVKGLVEKWKPAKLGSEGEYEKDLYAYLCENMDGPEVIRQFGSSRCRIDICVGRKVFIELKKDLDSTSKLQRLLGQIRLYKKEGWENLILVVTGKADPNLLKSATDGLRDTFNGMLTDETWAVIRK